MSTGYKMNFTNPRRKLLHTTKPILQETVISETSFGNSIFCIFLFSSLYNFFYSFFIWDINIFSSPFAVQLRQKYVFLFCINFYYIGIIFIFHIGCRTKNSFTFKMEKQLISANCNLLYLHQFIYDSSRRYFAFLCLFFIPVFYNIINDVQKNLAEISMLHFIICRFLFCSVQYHTKQQQRTYWPE